eukprot:Selendium_serpulae@DN4813_c0_g1_i1.p2
MSREQKPVVKEAVRATLSTTSKKALAAKSMAFAPSRRSHSSAEGGSATAASSTATSPTAGPTGGTAAGDKTEQKDAVDKTPEDTPSEPIILNNPCRVLNQQKPYIEFQEGGRYTPIMKGRKFGFLLLKDNQPEQPTKVALVGATRNAEPERAPPQPFTLSRPSSANAPTTR